MLSGSHSWSVQETSDTFFPLDYYIHQLNNMNQINLVGVLFSGCPDNWHVQILTHMTLLSMNTTLPTDFNLRDLQKKVKLNE